jgi:hypothetical protein
MRHPVDVGLNVNRQVLVGDEYFAYVDETEGGLPQSVGTGMLTTVKDVDAIVVSEAMEALKNDSEINRRDRKRQNELTLQRGYFHASDDSADAHSHFCTSIKKYVEGIFVCSLYDSKAVSESAQSELLSSTDLQNSAWVLAISSAEFGRTAVTMKVEKRQNLNVDKWRESYKHGRDWGRYDVAPSIPRAYPPITCTPADKAIPGLQVVDFLLRAALRSPAEQNRWAGRVGLSPTTTSPITTGSGTIGRTDIYSLGSATLDFPAFQYDQWMLAALDEHAVGEIERTRKYIAIEWLVCFCARTRPPAIEHLRSDIMHCVAILSDGETSFSSRAIEAMCRVFLRVFDTIPIYADNFRINRKDLPMFCAARNTASLAIRKDRTASRHLIPDMCRIRRHVAQTQAYKLPVYAMGLATLKQT